MKHRKKIILPANMKAFFSDSILSILALVLMNVVAQFVVYPIWAKAYGSETYGNIIYVMSIINIIAISLGTALNYTRMVDSASRETSNGDYNVILCVACPVAAVVCAAISACSIPTLTVFECVLIGLLCVCTTWRFYADVEYRLSLNYKGYFVYYAIISVGYLVGIGLFMVSDLWTLALLPGEIAGLAYVWKKGKLFRVEPLTKTANFSAIIKTSSVLVLTYIINNMIFNGDRLLLQNVLGGAAVTIYYLASLIGKTMTLITTPLNSVMIGHLAKYKNKFAVKHVWMLTGASLCVIAIATIGSLIGAHIIVRLLYPENYDQVKEFFVLANLTQIIYFVTNVLTTFLLRISKANRLLFIDVFYAVGFLILCFIGTTRYAIWGFCVSLLMVNVLRYLLAVILCIIGVKRQ